MKKAIVFFKSKNYELAIENYDRSVEINPSHSLAYSNRGFAKHQLGRHSEAIEDFNEAIKLDPNLAHTHYTRGLAYQALGEHEKAEADFAKAQELGYIGNIDTIS